MKRILLIILSVLYYAFGFSQYEEPIQIPTIEGVKLNWLVTPIDRLLASEDHNGNSHLQPVASPDLFIRDKELHVSYSTFAQLDPFPDYDGVLYTVYDALTGSEKLSISNPYQRSKRQQRAMSIGVNDQSDQININCFRSIRPIDSTGTTLLGGRFQVSTLEVDGEDIMEYYGDEQDSSIILGFLPSSLNELVRFLPTGINIGEETYIQNYYVNLNSPIIQPCLVYHKIDRNTGKITATMDSICMDHDISENLIMAGSQFRFQWDQSEQVKGFWLLAYDRLNPDNRKMMVGQLDRNYNQVAEMRDISDLLIDIENMRIRFTHSSDMLLVFDRQRQGAREGHIVNWLDREGNVLRSSNLITDPNGRAYTVRGAEFESIKLFDDKAQKMRYFLLLRSPDKMSIDIHEILETGEVELYRQMKFAEESSGFEYQDLADVSALSIDSVFLSFTASRNGGNQWTYLTSFSLRDSTTNTQEITNKLLGIKIFPTPFREQIHLELPQDLSSNIEFHLLNSLGQVVLTSPLDKGMNTISTTMLQPGNYHYRILGNKDWLTSGHLIKQ